MVANSNSYLMRQPENSLLAGGGRSVVLTSCHWSQTYVYVLAETDKRMAIGLRFCVPAMPRRV